MTRSKSCLFDTLSAVCQHSSQMYVTNRASQHCLLQTWCWSMHWLSWVKQMMMVHSLTMHKSAVKHILHPKCSSIKFMWGKACGVRMGYAAAWFELPTLSLVSKETIGAIWNGPLALCYCLSEPHSTSAPCILVVCREPVLLRAGCVLLMCPSVWRGVWRYAFHVSACGCRYSIW